MWIIVRYPVRLLDKKEVNITNNGAQNKYMTYLIIIIKELNAEILLKKIHDDDLYKI